MSSAKTTDKEKPHNMSFLQNNIMHHTLTTNQCTQLFCFTCTSELSTHGFLVMPHIHGLVSPSRRSDMQCLSQINSKPSSGEKSPVKMPNESHVQCTRMYKDYI